MVEKVEIFMALIYHTCFIYHLNQYLIIDD